MFKKFKDKLAEEVKSSPQRIQQFAQAAQAAVTSASSSISDITNNDLFSIGDNDASSKSRNSNSQQQDLQEVSLLQPGNVQLNIENTDHHMNQEMIQERQRERRLSNSSFASDISFRLPSYESPSMYHLQSDMEVSASEAEDRGFSGGTVNLDRVTKEQLYSAYRRTQDRCTKYKTQYADLARHYKLLERENAKAKNVLVETQDKALRRISELREQCSLEQSAKAHLEKSLRIDLEEKNMKIETLNTKLSFLQCKNTNEGSNLMDDPKKPTSVDGNENDATLITLATETTTVSGGKITNEDTQSSEIITLNNKIEKMEQLLNKYKDSLKTTKEKNSQLIAELQIMSTELDTKIKENDQLKATTVSLMEARKKIQELNENIEELQNKMNSNEFLKTKEMSILELNVQNAQEEVLHLLKKIEVLSKREEEYAISLAENKLSIHKELEGKENEIKSLKESLTTSQNEIQSLNIIINDYKTNTSQLEEENSKLRNGINELSSDKVKVGEVKAELESFVQKCQHLESLISKSDEEYKCLELQLKQETAEKLAMIDRNVYLENRNTQLLEENSKKKSQISHLEHELQLLQNNVETLKPKESTELKKYIEEVNEWKLKCSNLESEIQDERVELVKLQSEIEKLLANHELVQNRNETLNITINDLQLEIISLKMKVENANKIKRSCDDLKDKVVTLRSIINITLDESKMFKQLINASLNKFKGKIILLSDTANQDFANIFKLSEEFKKDNKTLQDNIQSISDQLNSVRDELGIVQIENETLKLEIKQVGSDNILYLEQIQNLKSNSQGDQNEILELMVKSENINEKLRLCNDEKLTIAEQNKIIMKENEKLKCIEIEKDVLKEEIIKGSNMYKELLNSFEVLSKEHDQLLDLKEVNVNKSNYIIDLEKRLEELKEENTSLKNLSDTISKSVIDIEVELKEVQKSHSQIEMEKDNLIDVIDKLEKKAAESKQLQEKIIQTDLDGSRLNDELVESIRTVKELKEEIQLLNEVNTTLSTQNKQNQLTIDQADDLLKQRNDACVTLKEDNRRLQSDIEGLQTHITKVSKENSQLNDKMRELIASTENVPEKCEISIHDYELLKNEIHISKEKIDSLIRESSLLAEENLELKDQIKTQAYSHSSITDTENSPNNLMYKYNNLLDTKNKLEKKLSELELMNNTINGNMLQVQTNNDKLKLSNEKLGLRLDEALVSLRHLHSLQENTELEYLKNILYEYLTGTGVHSITLAKVLAAVVKFDDRQTELVLQKEKERQGFLRQLGII